MQAAEIVGRVISNHVVRNKLGIVLRLSFAVNALELDQKLFCTLGAVNDDNIFIITRLGTSAEVIRSRNDNSVVEDDHLVMHQPLIAVQAHIQTGLLERIVLGAHIRFDLAFFHHSAHSNPVFGPEADRFAQVISSEGISQEVDALLSIVE